METPHPLANIPDPKPTPINPNTNPTPPATNPQLEVLEAALLKEHLNSATVLESIHLSAENDINAAAVAQLTYDSVKGAFVRRDTGEALTIREWLEDPARRQRPLVQARSRRQHQD